MQIRIASLTLSIAILLTGFSSFDAFAQSRAFPHTTVRGGSLNASTTQVGNRLFGTATATLANGKTATASGTATVRPNSIVAQGTANGPNGGTAAGTATASNGAVTASGTATGAGGNTVGGGVSAAAGTATLTNAAGNSKTISGANAPHH